MVHAMTFDTLQYAKKLIASGFTEQQAEGQAEAIAEITEIMGDRLATKQDIKELRDELKRDMKELRDELKRDMKELETKVETKIEAIEHRMIIKFGAMLVVAIGILSIVIKF